MNRRNFLKQIGIICTAAVVAPATLIKTKAPLTYKGVPFVYASSFSPGEWIDWSPFPTEECRRKYREQRGLSNGKD